MSSPDRVAVVGLGRMGLAAAAVLSERFEVIGWDQRPMSLRNVRMALSLEEIAESASVILGFLPSAEASAELFTKPEFRGAFDRGESIFVDASTSAPRQIRHLAQAAEGGALRLLDAPVLGRPESAGRWTMPVGGDKAIFNRARPVLELIAERVHHVGELGSANTIKLLNNLMFAAINVITAEAVGACEWLGVEPAKFVEIVGGSSAATVSPLFRSLAPRMLGQQLETVFTVELLDKDVRLALEMCAEHSIPLVSAPVLQEVTERALDQGLGAKDSAALVELYRIGSTHGK